MEGKDVGSRIVAGRVKVHASVKELRAIDTGDNDVGLVVNWPSENLAHGTDNDTPASAHDIIRRKLIQCGVVVGVVGPCVVLAAAEDCAKGA